MDSQFWSQWTDILRRGHLTSPLLTLLEGGGGFRALIAQGMLAVIPFIGTTTTSWKAFAEMLEDHHASRAFADHLRGEDA